MKYISGRQIKCRRHNNLASGTPSQLAAGLLQFLITCRLMNGAIDATTAS